MHALNSMYIIHGDEWQQLARLEPSPDFGPCLLDPKFQAFTTRVEIVEIDPLRNAEALGAMKFG